MRKELFALLVLSVLILTACSMPVKPTQIVQPVTPQTQLETPTIEVIAQAVPSATAILPEAKPSPTPTKKISLRPTPTTESVFAPEETYLYSVQAGTPIQTSNFVDLTVGCNWMGVGGQVFSNDEQPVKGLIAEVGGTLGNEAILSLAITGGSTILGTGGFVVKLADQPVASDNTLWIQLFDLAGTPKSEKIYFSTFGGTEGCEKNLVIVNFREIGTMSLEYYLPSIFKNGK